MANSKGILKCGFINTALAKAIRIFAFFIVWLKPNL